MTYIKIDNNNIQHTDFIGGHGKARICLEKLQTMSDELEKNKTDQDYSKHMDVVVQSAEEVYGNFNKKLGLVGRAVHWVKSLFGKGDHYIQRVDALFDAISARRVKVHTYIVGYESGEAYKNTKSLWRGVQFVDEPIKIVTSEPGIDRMKETEKDWKRHDSQPIESRLIFFDSSMISRFDALSPLDPIFRDRTCTIIIVGSDESRVQRIVNEGRSPYPSIADWFGLVGSPHSPEKGYRIIEVQVDPAKPEQPGQKAREVRFVVKDNTLVHVHK